MTLEATCADRHEAIAALVLGELAKPEADALRQHLAQCEGCRRLHDAMAMEEQAVVSAFDAISRRGQDVQNDILRRVATLKRRFVVPRRIGIVAAAAVVVVAAAFAVDILTRQQVSEEPVNPTVTKDDQIPTHFSPSPPAPPRETELAMADRMFGARDVDGLMDLLAHGTPTGQIAAANYLAKIGDARALDMLQRLRDAYSGSDPNNPFAAAMAKIQARLAPAKEKPSIQEGQEPNAPIVPAAGQAVETITYAGTVHNGSGEPIEGVAVRSWLRRREQTQFEGWELVGTTDRDGRFEIGPLPVADPRKEQLRTLVFEHPKYAVGWFSPDWGGNRKTDQKNLDVSLLEPTVFSGTVVDPNGEPIEGAIVEAELQLTIPGQFFYFDMSRLNGYAVQTNAAGEFSLLKVPTGARLHLRVSKNGYVHYASRENFQGDMYPMRPGQDVQVELTPGATVLGQVLLHGQPYEKAGLGITAEEESGYGSVTLTDTQGRFEMTDLAPGRYTVTVEYEGIAREGLCCHFVPGLEVKSGAIAQTVDLHLEEGTLVSVTVVDMKTREPVRDEQVVATADTTFASTRTDERGRCVLRLAAGQYRLGVRGWRDGKWAQFWKDVTVPVNAKEFSVSMEIAARPFIRGWLVDRDRRPLRGTVRIGPEEPVTTTKDGAFACPEPWWSPGDILVGYAFDETATLGRAFFWKPGGTIDGGDVVLRPLQGFNDGETKWTGTLSGRVVNEANEPMVGLTVHTSMGMQNFEDTTDLKGRYMLKGLPRGKRISGSVYADGYGHTMFQATVDGNDLDIQLFPQGWELLNKPAPGLFVEKWINAENVILEQYRGKVVVLQIGVLLPKDPAELERMQNLLNQYSSQGLQVMAIHQRLDIIWAGKVTEDDLRAFVATRDITFPLGIDAPVKVVRALVGEKALGNGAMYSLYDVKATPAVYLIDKKGVLRISPKRDELDAWINRLLREP